VICTMKFESLTSASALLVAALAVIPTAAVGASPAEPEFDQDREVLFQVSTIDALLLSVYDGILTIGGTEGEGRLRDRHLR